MNQLDYTGSKRSLNLYQNVDVICKDNVGKNQNMQLNNKDSGTIN